MKSARKLTSFGEKAEKMRIERGMPKTELCRRIGISATYYYLIIHGKRPDATQKQKILDVLDMSNSHQIAS